MPNLLRRPHHPSTWLAIAFATCAGLAGPARADLSPSRDAALGWQAEKQKLELDLVEHLRDVFDRDPGLHADVEAYAKLVLKEIATELDNPKTAAKVAERVLAIRVRSLTALPAIDDPIARAKAKVATLQQAAITVGMLGDLLWMHNHVIAVLDGDPRYTEMFATRAGIGGIAATAVWTETAHPGRLRVVDGSTDYVTVKTVNDEGDAMGLHELVAQRAPGSALARTALRPGSVTARISRGFGLMLGADISGSTNVYLWQLAHFKQSDPVWRLLPLVTLVGDSDHTLLEVALVLDSFGLIKYELGNYLTLLPSSSHPSKAAVLDVLAHFTKDARNHRMICWYGTSAIVEACRRDGGSDALKAFVADDVYPVFYKATDALNAYGFPKNEAIFAPWK